MPKLLILTDNPKEYIDLLHQADLPNLEIFTEFNPECDIVFGDTSRIKDTLANLPNLKWVQTTSAGVDRLMDPSLRRDYMLTNAKNVFGESMSEYVFGYMLFFKKRIRPRILAQRAKQWDNEDGGVLRGKTLGLIGVGSIGTHIAMTAKHFRMNVWGYTQESETSKHVDRYFHPESPSPREASLQRDSGRGRRVRERTKAYLPSPKDLITSLSSSRKRTRQIASSTQKC